MIALIRYCLIRQWNCLISHCLHCLVRQWKHVNCVVKLSDSLSCGNRPYFVDEKRHGKSQHQYRVDSRKFARKIQCAEVSDWMILGREISTLFSFWYFLLFFWHYHGCIRRCYSSLILHHSVEFYDFSRKICTLGLGLSQRHCTSAMIVSQSTISMHYWKHCVKPVASRTIDLSCFATRRTDFVNSVTIFGPTQLIIFFAFLFRFLLSISYVYQVGFVRSPVHAKSLFMLSRWRSWYLRRCTPECQHTWMTWSRQLFQFVLCSHPTPRWWTSQERELSSPVGHFRSQLHTLGTHYHPTSDPVVLWTPSNDTSRPISSDSLNPMPPAPLHL